MTSNREERHVPEHVPWRRTQLARGIGFAAGAALLFGVTAPLLKCASDATGTFAAASLLYLGAAAGAGAMLVARGRGSEPFRLLFRPLTIARVTIVALFGAVVAPALLIAGLRRANAATCSLLLALEAPFTLLLARMAYREHLTRRVAVAAAFIGGGGTVLAIRSGSNGFSVVGAALVAAAALAWAVDNVVSRSLADADPLVIVAAKAIVGSCGSAMALFAAGETAPWGWNAAALLAIGAFGYAISLQLYLRAQSLVGAGRTASVFAVAPFCGAAAALALGSAWPGWHFPAAAALILIGVVLHARERHEHAHTHAAMHHDHMHHHDDFHHDHRHDPMPDGGHPHPHDHASLTHDHDHSEDLHHRHKH